MKRILHLLTAVGVAQFGVVLSAPERDALFDDGWRFHRGDIPGAEAVDHDDSGWRTLDLPHDWSIEDLPADPEAPPEIEAVRGVWRFHKGDDPRWKERELDETDWEEVRLPDCWENHSDHTEDHVYGWYRRRIAIPADCAGRDFVLLLGRIDDVDETWFNGRRIGATGSFPPDYRWADTVDRRYRVPAGLARGDGTDVIAVRVFDGANNGGILEPGTPSQAGPFSPELSENKDKTGHTVGGVGWYRKRFALDAPGKRVRLRFDGVYMNGEFWVNGSRLGEWPSGYSGFEFDVTPHLRSGDNIVAVRVRNEGKNSRWYSGSGIYRHVWLTVVDPLHVPLWGVFVTTPEVSPESALVRVSVETRNLTDREQAAQLRVRLENPTGYTVAAAETTVAVPPGATATQPLEMRVDQPALWSCGNPALHRARVEIMADGALRDAVCQTFGIRKVEIDAGSGFRLNGKSIKLKGGNVHHDNGALGAAAIDRAEERKVELLQANGFNAIRCSHNPPSPALLDAADRAGMLVIDEAFDQWRERKLDNEQDYHRFFDAWHERDIAAMVRRDRNHPSVVMWSIGNEIPEQFRASETAAALRAAVLAHDDTRPVTAAVCTDWGRVIRNWDELSDPAFIHLDVAGYNYLPDKYESDHARHPDRVIYGAESYPKDAALYWGLVEKHNHVIGDFVWTALDYPYALT